MMSGRSGFAPEWPGGLVQGARTDLFVRRAQTDLPVAVAVLRHVHVPGAAAYRAILDIGLPTPAAFVNDDVDNFAAVWAACFGHTPPGKACWSGAVEHVEESPPRSLEWSVHNPFRAATQPGHALRTDFVLKREPTAGPVTTESERRTATTGRYSRLRLSSSRSVRASVSNFCASGSSSAQPSSIPTACSSIFARTRGV